MIKHAGIKVLAIGIASLSLMIMLAGRKSSDKVETHANPNNINQAIASQFNDNIRDVSARLQESEKKLEQLQSDNKNFRTLKQTPSSAKTDKLEQELDSLRQQIASMMSARSQKGYELKTTESYQGKLIDIDSLTVPQSGVEGTDGLWPQTSQKVTESTSTPYYTIPAGSDFNRVTLLSSLIGEVPNDGKLMQPLFPFSAIVSRGDLMSANGIELPSAIVGMKVMGYSIGVGSFLDNISCVRAYITSVLFVFDDGHFTLQGQEKMKGSAELINNESIGYLSTQYGNPCIKGRYISNAPQVLSTLMLASGIQGAGKALSDWQMSYQTGNGSTTTVPTGSIGHFAAGGAIDEGSQQLSSWLEKRTQGSFDMVYVPASQKVKQGMRDFFKINQYNLHFTQTINIDKSTQGRAIDYANRDEARYDHSLR